MSSISFLTANKVRMFLLCPPLYSPVYNHLRFSLLPPNYFFFKQSLNYHTLLTYPTIFYYIGTQSKIRWKLGCLWAWERKGCWISIEVLPCKVLLCVIRCHLWILVSGVRKERENISCTLLTCPTSVSALHPFWWLDPRSISTCTNKSYKKQGE